MAHDITGPGGVFAQWLGHILDCARWLWWCTLPRHYLRGYYW